MISRLPSATNYDNRYFNDTHEGLPVDGYTALLERMADHPRITVELDTDFFTSEAYGKAKTVGNLPIVYTGPVDRYFDSSLGTSHGAPSISSGRCCPSATSRAPRS